MICLFSLFFCRCILSLYFDFAFCLCTLSLYFFFVFFFIFCLLPSLTIFLSSYLVFCLLKVYQVIPFHPFLHYLLCLYLVFCLLKWVLLFFVVVRLIVRISELFFLLPFKLNRIWNFYWVGDGQIKFAN